MATAEVSRIELHFPLQADQISADHSYQLYGAICGVIPDLHEATWLGIHSIKGRLASPGVIKVSRFAKLRLRLPHDKIFEVLPLAGKTLDLAGHMVRVGIPQVLPLIPSRTLRARLVTMKLADHPSGTPTPEVFLEAVRRHLNRLGVSATPELESHEEDAERGPYARRILRIKDVSITGYGVVLRDVAERDSITLQEIGMGGRRKMGCGLFVPVRSG